MCADATGPQTLNIEGFSARSVLYILTRRGRIRKGTLYSILTRRGRIRKGTLCPPSFIIKARDFACRDKVLKFRSFRLGGSGKPLK